VSDIKPWPRKQHKVLADCRIFSVNEGLAVSPLTSKEHSFYFLETADWVNIVPMTDAGEIVCIRQYRHGSESITIEIPGGMVDMGNNRVLPPLGSVWKKPGMKCQKLSLWAY